MIMTKYLQRYKNKTILFFIVFYTVGILGIVFSPTRPLFIHTIPLVLIMSSIAITLFHSHYQLNTLVVFAFIIVLSYFVEVVGVSSQMIFGRYFYGGGLGVKVLDTPLLIGINWAMLVYCSASIVTRFSISPMLKIVSASVLMVIYDLVLEQVAPILDMWYWTENNVPTQNYVVWFILALLFHGLVIKNKVETSNPVAPAIFLCQLFFFVFLLIFLV